jgi:thiol-disulfide isomerase/thioredoxin
MFAMIALVACESPRPPVKIQIGQSLPHVMVSDLEGRSTKLSLAAGKITILNIWATWCGPCRHEMPSLDRMANLLDKDKFQVIGLSFDTDDYVVREFLIERKVTFKNYIDSAMQVSNSTLGVRAFPSTFIFSADGKLLEVIEGWRDWDTKTMVQRMENLADS